MCALRLCVCVCVCACMDVGWGNACDLMCVCVCLIPVLCVPVEWCIVSLRVLSEITLLLLSQEAIGEGEEGEERRDGAGQEKKSSSASRLLAVITDALFPRQVSLFPSFLPSSLLSFLPSYHPSFLPGFLPACLPSFLSFLLSPRLQLPLISLSLPS